MLKQNNSYYADLHIDVMNQFLSANLVFNYHCNFLTKELKFYIYKDIAIENINSETEMIYKVDEKITNWCPFVLESKLIIITFDKPIDLGECVNIHFRYKGHIGIVTKYGINRITKEWVELGLYTPWFPILDSLEMALFNVNISIDEKYIVVNSIKTKDNLVLNQTIPSIDCSIIASSHFNVIKKAADNIEINIFFIEDKDKSFAESIDKYSQIILNKYFDFGKINDRNLSIVLLPREDGGGYCRPNLIVLNSDDYLNDNIGGFKYIAHELAHLWWNKSNPNSWEDWLNESFAEYSALLVLRDIYGENIFNSKIDKYKIKSEGLPPIKEIDRNHEKAYEVLYIKGPLLLFKLEKQIGRDKFVELLNLIHISAIDSTDKFLNKLGEITNQVIEDNFRKLISM